MSAKKSSTSIVCGTDFSLAARGAADVAAALAVAFDEPLRLVHVAPEAGPLRMTAASRRALLAPRRDALAKEAERLRGRGAEVRPLLRTGTADAQLVRLASQPSVRCVIVGALGSRTGGGWLLGSVADRVASSAPVPTLVVRSAAPFTQWLSTNRPLRVFVAFDWTLSAESGLEWVRELARLGRCELTVGHVCWPPEARARFGAREASSVGLPPAVQSALERDLRERCKLLLGAAPVEVRVRPAWGREDMQLVEMAAEARADLVVTGTHQRQGLPRLWAGSVSRDLLQNAPVSVACVPRVAAARREVAVPELRRVLVTTDFSPFGDVAIGYACALLRPGGVLRVAHVVHPRAVGDSVFAQELGSSPREARYQRLLRRRLEDLLPAAAEGLGVATEAVLLRGREVAPAICEEAERFGADAVVIASKGASGLSRVALGSVARAVLTRSRRPVFVMRVPEA
jgi:nucleotide-binding universal stress UspA family protein